MNPYFFTTNVKVDTRELDQTDMEIMEVDDQLASLSLVDTSIKMHDRKRRLSGRWRNVTSVGLEPSEDIGDEIASCSGDGPRRSARKKIRALESEKRRVTIKPKKLKSDDSLAEIKNYYLDKKVKRLPPTLETIFEEPQEKKNDIVLMSARKFKRCIDFVEAFAVNRHKIKKRVMKAKKLTANRRVATKKVSMDYLMQKLENLSDSEDKSSV